MFDWQSSCIEHDQMIRALAPDRADQALKNTLPGLYRRVDPMSRILFTMSLCLACRWNGRRIVKKNIPTPASGTGSPSSQATSHGGDHARRADGSAANCV
jgi:hypothetical protein